MGEWNRGAWRHLPGLPPPPCPSERRQRDRPQWRCESCDRGRSESRADSSIPRSLDWRASGRYRGIYTWMFAAECLNTATVRGWPQNRAMLRAAQGSSATRRSSTALPPPPSRATALIALIPATRRILSSSELVLSTIMLCQHVVVIAYWWVRVMVAWQQRSSRENQA